MSDTFGLARSLERQPVRRAVIVGAGYIGLERAEALTTRGLSVTQIEQLPEVLPTACWSSSACVWTPGIGRRQARSPRRDRRRPPDAHKPHRRVRGRRLCVTYHRLLGDTYLPLRTSAHKQGRVAGENALGAAREFAGSLGTQVVKIFDLVAARTGLRDHEAAGSGLTPLTVAARADDHKAYWVVLNPPEAEGRRCRASPVERSVQG